MTLRWHFLFFFFCLLLPLGVAAADHLASSYPIPTILLCHTNPLRVLLHYLHELFVTVCL